MKKISLLALLMVLAGCNDPTDPFPDHPGMDSSFPSKRMRSEDSGAFPAYIVVTYDCKNPSSRPPSATPKAIPGEKFTPNITAKQEACTPAGGIINNEKCTQQVWTVSASYDCPRCSTWLSYRMMNDVPFGTIECACECVKASGGCDGSGRHSAGNCVDPSSQR